MATVATMRGEVAPGDLGRTLMHEHVFVLTTEVQANFAAEFDEGAAVETAVARLTELSEQGVATIVDPTVVGLGRNIPLLARVAGRVELNIVVATGIYTYDSAPFFFRHRGPALGPEVPDPMVEMFLGDIRDGIADTGVRAGMLKCAIDEPGLTADVERIMRAVAQTHVETRSDGGAGTPITVHTHPSSETGSEVHRVLSSEGVDPGRVVLGHSGDTTDADHLAELAELGYVLGMDRFGLYLDRTFEERVDVVAELCRRGYADRMVLSQDASCHIDWMPPEVMEFLPDWHYLHVLGDVVPALQQRGVSDAQVEQMLVDVPRRVLTSS